ncbi:MAG: tetratricopeptide repeat protein [Thermodesulfobacteriota bacterium]
MNITRLKPVSVVVPFMLLIFTGCYPKTDIQDLYDRQAALEARIDKLTEDMEAGLSRINQDIGKVEAGQQRLALDVEALKLRNAAADRTAVKTESRKNGKNGKTVQAKPKTPSNTPEFIFSRAAASYNDGQYEDAILEYQKLIDTYPKDKRVPEAYLKQGLSLINLGRKQEAKYFLNTLIDKYPNSHEAQTAREKLKTI